MNVLPMTSMSTEFSVPVVPRAARTPRVYHRIREVRLQQGISLRTAARHLRTDLRSARAEEEATADLSLSQLYKWQRVLDVPVSELLHESDDVLSRPVMERARLVRIMQTAQSMLEKAPNPPMQRLAQMLTEQLVELMPELAEVTAWHNVGQRRKLEDMGRAADAISVEGFASEVV